MRPVIVSCAVTGSAGTTEPSATVPRTSAPGNAALVERAVTIVEALGEKIATPAEARQLLGLG